MSTPQSALAPSAAASHVLRLASGVCLEGRELQQAVEVFVPPQPVQARALLVCLPGGGMNRRFFDLTTPEGDTRFSFARQLAAQGYIVATLDHLGIGDSDQPEDGHALTTELLARGSVAMTRALIEGLSSGALLDGLGPLPGLQTVGVGHSMGAMLAVVAQAESEPFDGLALLGFGTRGLPQFLPPAARELGEDSAALRRAIPKLARAMFREPYPRVGRSPREGDFYGSANADPAAVNALKKALAPLLPYPAFQSLLPGNVAPEAGQIRVPVFLAVGDKDMVGEPREIPGQFPASASVELHILPETGHSHFLFASREQLFAQLGNWAGGLVDPD